MKDFFELCPSLAAHCGRGVDFPTVRLLFETFTAKAVVLTCRETVGTVFEIGVAPTVSCPAGKEYAVRVTSQGASVRGADEKGLFRGIVSLLMKIDLSAETLRIPCGEWESGYGLNTRMIHFCVFPETDKEFLKKMIRLAGLCQYTHVVLEFWGSLRYDCLKELSWQQAFSKAEAAELIGAIRAFGMEPVPMFNHLGHAAASRVCYGKHVVLDQNPALHRLFTPDGWAWNIASSETAALLKSVRAELDELFGKGEFFHLGCDEAYYLTGNDALRRLLPSYLSALTEEVVKEGRRPMLWMDMLLPRGKFACATATGDPEEIPALMGALAKETVAVDWQYGVGSAPVESSVYLKETCGMEVIGAPWLSFDAQKAHIETAKTYGLRGVMITTWNTLKEDAPGIYAAAQLMGAATFDWAPFSGAREITASLLRRAAFRPQSYAECGWSQKQVEV